jgi:tyrosyl-tRNA synthetase
MFGGVMAQDDEMLEILFLNNTLLSKEEIQEILKTDARDAKLRLASEIVKIFYGEEKAREAQKNWITQFSDKKIPDNLEEFEFPAGTKILEILKETNLVPSNKEGRRKIDEGAVKILDNEGNEIQKIEDYFEEIAEGEKILKLGKKMVKIRI